MNDFLAWAAQNTLIAFGLALLVAALTRVWRSPAVAHLLWMLILLKLVAPPMWGIECTALPDIATLDPQDAGGSIDPTQPEALSIPGKPSEATQGTAPRSFLEPPAQQAATSDPAPGPIGRPTDAGFVHAWNRMRTGLFSLWIAGVTLCGLLAAVRIVRFERRLRGTLPPPEGLVRLAANLARRIGLRGVPTIRCVASGTVPLVWWAGRRPAVVLPLPLIRELDDEEVAMILTHELAHLRRRDHWVRLVEMGVSIVHWWNPLVRVIRRRIHEAEDLCCDAWVCRLFPDGARQYAETLLKALESLEQAPGRPRLLPASPLFHSVSSKERIEMLLNSRLSPSPTTGRVLAIVLLALLVLPSFVRVVPNETRADTSDEPSVAPATKTDVPKFDSAGPDAPKAEPSRSSEFPHGVEFELGATRFLDADQVTIVEVRGTDKTIAAGNIYWVRGTYTLASHDRATLAAYVTATDAAHARSTPLKSQSVIVQRGSGSFALFLPVSHRGYPHVSFYPAEGGNGFGGIYFGTGDSVMKPKTARPDPPKSSELPHRVKFEQGATRFESGDDIRIEEVRGTAETMTAGNIYWIRGSYTLASRDRAGLSAYVTSNGSGPSFGVQSTAIERGTGTFTLFLPMSVDGWPHVSFYPAGSGESFGGNYFGTGDSVMKNWFGSAAVQSDIDRANSGSDYLIKMRQRREFWRQSSTMPENSRTPLTRFSPAGSTWGSGSASP